MAITNNLKKLIHRKSPEYLAPLALNTAAGTTLVGDKRNLNPNSVIYAIINSTSVHRYDGDEDSWLQLPVTGAAGAGGAGSCADYRGLSAMGGIFTQQATAGGVATITTNRTIVRNLSGRRIRVIGGLGLGFDGTIFSNTIGANSVITTSGSTTFDNTTQYQIFAGSLWYQNAGTAGGFVVYDAATNVWTSRAVTGAASWGTDGYLVATPGGAEIFLTSTVTSAASTTLTDTTKAWLTNQWANHQVRISAGTGVGQIRTISSNTGTVLTVSSAWTVNPDATSTYIIEGNDDYFYLLGNNAVTLYRYSVSANTWTTLTPTAARAGASGAGMSGSWVSSVPTWALNSNGSPNALTVGSTVYKQNGRYILSFRGNATNTLDLYDISANTWISGVDYGNRNETFTLGTNSVDYKGDIFIMKEATQRVLKFSIDDWAMKSFTYNPIPQGTAVVGQKLAILPYVDGADELVFLYGASHTRTDFIRNLII
jgi:hypothetical protein